MKLTKQFFATTKTGQKLFQHLLLNLLLELALLLMQSPAYALQFESVAMRNMTSYKKFEGLSQNAVVIKSRENRVRYLDRFEFASGELSNGETKSAFVSVGPAWRFNRRVARSGLAFIEFGTSPTWISNDNFEDEKLGGHVYFTSNIQLGVHFGYRRELTLSLRLHHISNGGINSTNPGTDMLGLEMSYLFNK